MEAESLLYKYCPLERVEALTNLLLRFTPLHLLNDPLDGRFAVGPHPSEVDKAKDDNYRAEWAEVEVFISYRMANLGVLCLSKRPDSMPMWAHYASNHRGFLIGISRDLRPFDGRAFIWSDYRTEIDLTGVAGFGSFRDVEYDDGRYEIPFGEEVPWDAFFTKSRAWSYEEEVRIFRAVGDAASVTEVGGGRIHLFAIPPRSIRRVVVGAHAGDDVVAAARQLGQRPELRELVLQRAEVDHRQACVRFQPL